MDINTDMFAEIIKLQNVFRNKNTTPRDANDPKGNEKVYCNFPLYFSQTVIINLVICIGARPSLPIRGAQWMRISTNLRICYSLCHILHIYIHTFAVRKKFYYIMEQEISIN